MKSKQTVRVRCPEEQKSNFGRNGESIEQGDILYRSALANGYDDNKESN